MMKYILILLISMSFQSFFAQRNIVQFEYQYNIDIWAPYSEQGEVYQDKHGNTSSNTWGLDLKSQLIYKTNWGINIGLAYKKINYSVKDHITNWNYITYPTSPSSVIDTIYTVFDDPADLIVTSNSFGLTFEGYYTVFNKEKVDGSLGLKTEVFFLEYYNAYYQSDDFQPSYSSASQPPASQGPRNKLLLSSINTSLFFRTNLYSAKRFSLGAKLSLGANIYSDWEQFKRYVWLGVGLEIGFLGKEKNSVE